MYQRPGIDIHAAIGSRMVMRPNPNKEIFPSQNDLIKLDGELEQRKRDALALVRENRLKDASNRAELFEQQRLKAKQVIFNKYFNTIEKELQILKIQLEGLNEFHLADAELFRLRRMSCTGRVWELYNFETNLQAVRSSTCYFKYCCPQQDCCSRLSWLVCWCTLPLYCCYRGCLKESKSHIKLQELYERYEQLMVAENQAIACPHR